MAQVTFVQFFGRGNSPSSDFFPGNGMNPPMGFHHLLGGFWNHKKWPSSNWWFQTCFIFSPTWGNDPI